MSHLLVAAVWEGLQSRNDISNILNEILGQHTLDLLHLQETSPVAVTNRLCPIIWIKTIFDLQRTYLQATAGAHDCAVPGLISTDLLYSTLIYLLHVKTKLFPSTSPLEADALYQRMLLAHTLLSGLRLLVLRNEYISPEKLQRLESTLQVIWEEHDLPECEHFLLFELFPEVLDAKSPTESQAGNDFAIGLRQVGVPTFAEGLYPLRVRPIKLITQTFSNLRKGGPRWLCWYWILFDAIWASESALVQAHVDQYRENKELRSPAFTHTQALDMVTQLQNARQNIIAAVFGSPKSSDLLPGTCILESLNATVIGWHENLAFSATASVPEKQAMYFNNALRDFAKWIEERNVKLNGLANCISCGLASNQQLPRKVHGSVPLTAPMSPLQDKETIFSTTQRDTGFNDAPSSSDAASLTHTATSGSMSSSAAGAAKPAARTGSNEITPFTPNSSQALHRSHSDHLPEAVVSKKDSWSARRKTLRRALNPSKEKLPKDAHLCRPASFSFSSSGHSLILWGGNIRGFMRITLSTAKDAPIKTSVKWELNAVKQVASGNERCVAIASHQERFKLVTFHGSNPLPEAQIDLDISMRHYTETYITVSQDDSFAALVVNNSIQLYRLSRGHIGRIAIHDQTHLYQHLASQRRFSSGADGQALSTRDAAQEAHSESTVVERKLAFSPSSEKLVVAAHLADHHVYVDVFDCKAEPCITMTTNPIFFKLPPWTSNDGGLTSVFFDDIHNFALITAFISKEYPSVISLGNNEITDGGSFGSKVVYAAQSTSGSSFIIANGMTDIIHLPVKENGIVSPRKLKRCAAKIASSAFKPGNIALAMPGDSTIFAFWMKDTKLLLRTMKIGEGESYSDTDIRVHIDRLHQERSEPLVLSNSAAALESIYGEPAMLQSEPAIRQLHSDCLVELPGTPGEKGG